MNKGFERTTDLCFAIFMARDQTAKREPEREREKEGWALGWKSADEIGVRL